jgi:hypothetical protein
MDILEEKQKGELDNKIKILFKKLKFFSEPIELKGSSVLKSQKFFSDYDLFSDIKKKYEPKKTYNKFKKIFNDVLKDEDNYFIEFKIQTKDGKKIKWFSLEEFNYDEFEKVYDDIDFCKIDLITRIENKFFEVSCIYKFSYEKLTKEKYIKNLKEDINELEKEKKYYKILKRKFNIYKVKDDKKKLLELSQIFNSPLGEKYQLLSNLEAMKKLLDITNDDKTIKKIIINLKDQRLEPNVKKIDEKIKMLNDEINTEAKNINKNFQV